MANMVTIEMQSTLIFAIAITAVLLLAVLTLPSPTPLKTCDITQQSPSGKTETVAKCASYDCDGVAKEMHSILSRFPGKGKPKVTADKTMSAAAPSCDAMLDLARCAAKTTKSQCNDQARQKYYCDGYEQQWLNLIACEVMEEVCQHEK